MARSVIGCIRLYTGPDGRSHVERADVPLGVAQRVKSARFEETAAGAALDWHTAPCAQFVITLTGTLAFVTRDGETFILRPGDVLLAADTTGTGHRWRLIDDQPWRRVYIELADPVPEAGSAIT
jgi:quercetin dioxygenase-like cupin family protein